MKNNITLLGIRQKGIILNTLYIYMYIYKAGHY